MTKKIALVSGSSGFIGTHLVRHLESCGYEVRGADIRSGIDIRTAPPRVLDSLCSGVDSIFHLAGLADIIPSIENPEQYFSTNVQGTIRILEAARRAGVNKFVIASSSSCYGDNPSMPTTEDAKINTCYPYALSKYLGEQAVMHWGKVYGMNVTSLRLFNVYGRGSKTSGAYGAVMGTFLKQKLSGAPLTIVGDGNQMRDFVHVSDVCEAFILAGQAHGSNIINIGSGAPQSINSLARLIGGSCVHLPKRPAEPMTTWADITRAKIVLGWSPQVKFVDGINDMLAHIDEWKDAPLWDERSIELATKPWFDALVTNKEDLDRPVLRDGIIGRFRGLND